MADVDVWVGLLDGVGSAPRASSPHLWRLDGVMNILLVWFENPINTKET